MIEEDNFYVTLSSNASADIYPENTLTHFWNKCTQPLSLKSGQKWSVALVEFRAPARWNVFQSDGDLSFSVTVSKPRANDRDEVDFVREDFELDYVQFQKEGLRHLKEVLKSAANPEVRKAIGVVNYQGETSITIKRHAFLNMSRRVLAVLGVPCYEREIGVRRVDGDRCLLGSASKKMRKTARFSPTGGLNTLWVYSNVCAYRMVGDTRAPLLRPVAVTSYDQHTIYADFSNPHYLPVSQDYFRALEILIRDTEGHPVPFVPGEVIVTLHFRHESSL